MRFAGIMESLGVSLIDSMMTLIAFLPILWGLSSFVTHLPIVGEVPQALVFVAILWSIFGTRPPRPRGHPASGPGVPQSAGGGRLPQGARLRRGRCRARAAADRRGAVRQRAAELLQALPQLSLLQHRALRVSPGGGAPPLHRPRPHHRRRRLHPRGHAADRAGNSAEWRTRSSISSTPGPTIVELLSIYKRLQAFEAAINDQPLPKIDRDFMEHGGDPA